MTDLNAKSHDEAIRHALISLNVNPYYVLRRYIEAVIEEEDFNLSATSRRLGMQRRTIQRMLAKNRPPVHKAVTAEGNGN